MKFSCFFNRVFLVLCTSGDFCGGALLEGLLGVIFGF